VLKIGLTGGIGAGKSVVSDIFASLGVPIIDADVVSREILQPGSDALAQLAEKLGPSILDADGNLQRKQLKQLIFDHAETRLLVDSILHPAIKSAMLQQLSTIQAKYCLLVIPLLVEKHWASVVDSVLLVDAPETVRMQRIRDRDQLNTQQIQQIFDSQTSHTERVRNADDIINNDQNLDQLTKQVNLLHQKYSAH